MCHNKIDLVILLDGSGSVKLEQFNIAKKFVSDLIKHFDISNKKTNVAVATYSQYTNTGRTFNDDVTPESVLKAVDGLSYEGAASRLDFGFDLIEFELFEAKNGARTNDKGQSYSELHSFELVSFIIAIIIRLFLWSAMKSI